MLIKAPIKYLFVFLCSLFALCIFSSDNCYAADSDNSYYYRVVISDNADLLTAEEEANLTDIMEEVAAFGNVILLTESDNPYSSARDLSETTYEHTFNSYADGVIFTIDMDTRMLWISGYGELQYIITDNYCDTITDNVYRFASNEEYYNCSAKAFSQIHSLLIGKNIPQPMKYICNFLLSLIIALILNYFAVLRVSKKREPSMSALKQNMLHSCHITDPQSTYLREKRVYSPRSSGGSGGGGGGGGGGGCSGGGHSF